ncbi:MAG TPA: ABC transporter substrate-binding protein [Dehalococcoidia bacterium]|nr:ABC transporter substrate-binding protein [Dehalococcoidia bacterium]
MARPDLKRRWYLPVILLAGVVAVIAFWVYASDEEGSPAAAYGGTYVEASAGAPQRVNPLYAGLNPADGDLVALVFSGLTRLGPEGRVLPDLAERWEISEDGTEYTFRLRNGTLWHDGEELTADDVVFTWSVLSSEDFDGDPDVGNFWQSVSVERIDDLTIRYTLEEPFSPFLSQTTMGILPEHLLAGVPVDEMAQSSFNEEPIGAGPYRLESLTTRSATLRSNDSFHLGPPYIEQIRIDYYVSDEAAVTAVRNGDADGVYVTGPLGRDQVTALDSDHELQELTLNSYTMLYLNSLLPAFQDDTVRRAIAFAIDREAIVDGTLAGRGAIADSVITPGTWAFADTFEPYPYDPERAAALLADAGWIAGPNGIRSRDGIELTFDLITNNDSTRTAIAAAIAANLQEVGIAVNFSSSGSPTLYEQVLQPHQFEMALFGFAQGPDPDPFPAWHSSQAEGGANIAAFSDPTVDSDLEQARLAADRDRRAELYLRFQQTFYDLQPSVLLFYPVNLYVLPEDLQGVATGVAFTSSSRFSNVWEWYLETERVSDE